MRRPYVDRRLCVRSALAVSLLNVRLPASAEDIVLGTGGSRLASGSGGKPKPETGCILLEEVQTTGSAKAPTISAELVTNGGVAATVAFDSPWPVARGTYFDIEARSQEGDSAFVHVRSLPGETDLMVVPASYLTNAVFNRYGRFSAYGQPTDIKVLSDVTEGPTRYLEVNFGVLSASGGDAPRKGIIAAVQPSGSKDAIMLVTSATASRWKKSGADASARRAAESFRVVGSRPTSMARVPSSDYRFGTEGQSNVEKRVAVDGLAD